MVPGPCWVESRGASGLAEQGVMRAGPCGLGQARGALPHPPKLKPLTAQYFKKFEILHNPRHSFPEVDDPLRPLLLERFLTLKTQNSSRIGNYCEFCCQTLLHSSEIGGP